jgi:hypothetical protein
MRADYRTAVLYGAPDDPFTEVVRNEIPGENSPSIQATVASYVGIDRQESAAGAMGKRYAVTEDLSDCLAVTIGAVHTCQRERGRRGRGGRRVAAPARRLTHLNLPSS